jgi:hypothetical protein
MLKLTREGAIPKLSAGILCGPMAPFKCTATAPGRFKEICHQHLATTSTISLLPIEVYSEKPLPGMGDIDVRKRLNPLTYICRAA